MDFDPVTLGNHLDSTRRRASAHVMEKESSSGETCLSVVVAKGEEHRKVVA